MRSGGLRNKGIIKQSCPGKPLVSIITVTYNRDKLIEQAITSVICQTYDNIEYIIIDGGSSDDSVEIINKFSNKLK